MSEARHDENRRAPSGRQFQLRCGGQQATVVEVGGGLRHYSVAGRSGLDGYQLDERCTGARGLPLIPWPNRIADGAYSFDGADYQLPLTEPDKHNAIHGLLRWRNWTCRERTADRVLMGSLLHPMMGYPFTLDVTVEYSLSQTGLKVRTQATNLGTRTCPYGTGQHPYLSAGTELVDPCHLQLDASRWLPTNERGLPTGNAAVAGSAFDFRAGRQIGEQDIDYTFTELNRDNEGLAWVRFTGPDGWQVAVWADESYPFIELYTSHTQPEPHWRTGLGVEPMTCAPNAYRTGEGLNRLEPGESSSAIWGVQTSQQ